jgi:hypothetical protein
MLSFEVDPQLYLLLLTHATLTSSTLSKKILWMSVYEWSLFGDVVDVW